MSSSFLSEKQLGIIPKNTIISLDGVLGVDETFEYYFSVGGDEGYFTEITLNNLRDDLDLRLSQSNRGFYLPISESEFSGVDQEYIGKYLTAGDYLIEVKYYEKVNNDLESAYNISIDTKSFNATLPNDPFFNNQWYLFNTGQADGIENEDILAPEAWKIRSTSPDVIVAVIDLEVDIKHEDLINNLWVNSGEIPGNNFDDDGNGLVDDLNGWSFVNNSPLGNNGQNHGTHVAGTIGAEGNNNIGVAGVTWDVNIMSLDALSGITSIEALIEPLENSIYYAVNNGADVINMSLGRTYPRIGRPNDPTTVEGFKALYPAEHSRIERALNLAVKNGTTVVISAGNDNKDFDGDFFTFPAYFSELIEGVISVASLSNTGNASRYTNYGSQISIAAPGGEMYSEGDPGGIYNSIINNSYDFLQGTSMASPVVAGAISLMLGENPYLNPAQVESILQDTAFKYRSLENVVKNGGYLNLEGALQAASTLVDKTVVRLYNSSSGKHLFSSNKNEINILTGGSWKNEGALYYTPEEATAEVFRFYVSDENRHFYTALESERDMIIGNKEIFSGWEYEGGAFSAYSTSNYANDATAVVRYLNTENGSHVYSTSTYEQGLLDESSNWINEGIAWYGDPMMPVNDLV